MIARTEGENATIMLEDSNTDCSGRGMEREVGCWIVSIAQYGQEFKALEMRGENPVPCRRQPLRALP